MGAAGGKAAAVPNQGMGMAQGVGQQGFGAVQGVGNTGMGMAQGVGNTGFGAVQGVGNTGMGAAQGLPVVGGVLPFGQAAPVQGPEAAEVQAAQTVGVAPSNMPLNRRAAALAQLEATKAKPTKLRTFGPSGQGSFAGFGGHYSGYPYGAYSQGTGYAPTFSQGAPGTIGAGIAPGTVTSAYGSQTAYGSQAAFGSSFPAATVTAPQMGGYGATAFNQQMAYQPTPSAYGAAFPGTASSATRTVSGQSGITSLGAPPVGYE